MPKKKKQPSKEPRTDDLVPEEKPDHRTGSVAVTGTTSTITPPSEDSDKKEE